MSSDELSSDDYRETGEVVDYDDGAEEDAEDYITPVKTPKKRAKKTKKRVAAPPKPKVPVDPYATRYGKNGVVGFFGFPPDMKPDPFDRDILVCIDIDGYDCAVELFGEARVDLALSALHGLSDPYRNEIRNWVSYERSMLQMRDDVAEFGIVDYKYMQAWQEEWAEYIRQKEKRARRKF